MSDLVKIESREALDDAFAHEGTVLVFKHSLTCPVSSAAFDQYKAFLADCDDDTEHRLIEVQRQRELSREVATRTGVKHESPQALLLRGGEVVWNASHWHITQDSLREAFAG